MLGFGVLRPHEIRSWFSRRVRLRRWSLVPQNIRTGGSSQKSWNTVGIAQHSESLKDLSEMLKHCVDVRKESLESLAGGGDVHQELEGHPEVSRMLANLESNLDV